jgi:hypothetical protein
MAYIGNRPEQGNFRKCDAITTSATATYNLLVGGVAVNPNQNQCIVSLNGVIQSSGNSYTIASSQITFASTLASSDVIDFILILGDTLDVGVPSDDTVDASKITANIITGQSALGATPADTDELLISDAGTLKRVDYSHLKSSVVNRPNANPLSYNSNMAVAQRGTSSASISTGGYYTCDRWKFEHTGNAGTFTLSQSTDVPSGYGFANSFKMDCTTAQGTIGSGNRIGIRQFFEGQDLQLIKKGTANAEKITLAFWVKSTKTGTFIAELYDEDNSRQVSKAYTVSTTNTWEFKVINFPADTTGAFDNNNASSMVLFLWTGAGTNFTSGTLNTSWASATSANRAVGQVNASDSTSNDFLITGVQLEVGEYTASTIPPFQHESFGDNLRRCHRYCYVMGSADNAENGGQFTIGSGLVRSSGSAKFTDIVGSYPQPLRTLPSVTQVGGDMADLFCYKDDGTSADPTSISIGRNTIALRLTNNMGTSSGLTAGDATVQQIVEADTNLVFSAEL